MKKSVSQDKYNAIRCQVQSVLISNLKTLGIEREEFVILAYLLDKCWDKPSCWPSIKTIATDLGYSLQTKDRSKAVSTLINKLKKKKLISVEKKTRNRYSSNVYDLAPLFNKCLNIKKTPKKDSFFNETDIEKMCDNSNQYDDNYIDDDKLERDVDHPPMPPPKVAPSGGAIIDGQVYTAEELNFYHSDQCLDYIRKCSEQKIPLPENFIHKISAVEDYFLNKTKETLTEVLNPSSNPINELLN